MQKDTLAASHPSTLSILHKAVPHNVTSMKGSNAYRKVRRPVVDTLKLDACATAHGGE